MTQPVKFTVSGIPVNMSLRRIFMIKLMNKINKEKFLALLLCSFSLFGLASAQAQQPNTQMKVTDTTANVLVTGPEANFTGMVRVVYLFVANSPARASGGKVIFEPGARSAWHTHPLGQTLIVTEGSGLVQQWGGKVQRIKPGDVIWTPPGVKHWHGAGPTSGMSHIAITENLNGKAVEWMEKVSDEQYNTPFQSN
jgi:quercetin dioxygenase-like cupin family protein